MQIAQPTDSIRYKGFADIVTLIVGPDRKSFSVHKHVLVETSEFFRAALTGGFAEARSGVVELPTDDPKIVEYYIEFAYIGGHVPSYELLHSSDYKLFEKLWGPGQDFEENWLATCRFAEEKVVPKMQIVVANGICRMARMIDCEPYFPHQNFLQDTWSQLRDTDPLRVLLADWYLYGIHKQEWDWLTADMEVGDAKRGLAEEGERTWLEQTPPDFRDEVRTAAVHWGIKHELPTLPYDLFQGKKRCRYHRHDGVDKYFCEEDEDY